MRTSWYAKRILILLAILAAAFPFSRSSFIATMLYAIQVIGPLVGFYFLRKNRHENGLNFWNYRFFALSLLTLSFGDGLFFLLIHLKFGKAFSELLAITSVPYVLAFAFAALGFLASLEKPLGATFRRPIFWAFPVIVAAFTVPYLVRPLLMRSSDTLSTLSRVAIGVDISFVILLVAICFYILLSTRSTSWSVLALGFFSMGLTDWNANVESLNLVTTAISFNAFTWTFSGLLITLALSAPRARFEVIPPFRYSSLLGPFRLYMFLSGIIPLWFILIYARTNLTSAVIVSVAFMWSALAVVLISQTFLDRLKEVGELVSRLDSESVETISKVPDEFKEEILTAVQRKTEQSNALIEARIEAGERAARVAKQVAHDIRSPLAALSMIQNLIESSVPESTRILLRESVSRINDIANDLLARNRRRSPPGAHIEMSEPTKSVILTSVVDELVSEKRIEYRCRKGVSIEFKSDAKGYGIFAKVEPAILKRILSNVINNSVEAFDHHGKVVVSVSAQAEAPDRMACIEIRDDGCGIGESLLPALGNLGASYGKEGGAGLGLYHAKRSIGQWGGRLEIESTLGKGTTVRILLPHATPESWFVERLSLRLNQKVLVVDDDASIHGIWERVFGGFGGRVHCEHVYSAESLLRESLSDGGRDFSQYVCLIDYEFIGTSLTGLDLIERLGIQNNAMLVTSRFDDTAIQDRAAATGVRILPKSLACSIPIHYPA